MLFVPSNQITEGMCVAEDVTDLHGRMLIAKGQRLGPSHLQRLHKFGIQSLFIDQNQGARPAAKGKSSLRSQCETVLGAVIKGFAGEAAPQEYPDPGAVRAAADALVTSLVKAGKAIVILSGRTAEDEYQSQHAVNVAALAVALGIDMRLPRLTLIEIGSAMLLHDVGLMLLPRGLSQRSAPPSTMDVRHLKAHTVLGYDYVLKAGALSPDAADLVINHHERMDGSGYPRGMRGSQLTTAVRIAAVAEAFESLISTRCGIEAVLPDAALSWMLCSPHLFDRNIVCALGYRIALYPDGAAVRLTTGETGIVAGTLPTASRRPIVLIYTDSNGNDLPQPMIVDLTRETDRGVARSAPTLEQLKRTREAGAPSSHIDPILAGVG